MFYKNWFNGYFIIKTALFLALLFVYGNLEAQPRTLPELDFEKFRKDIASTESPEEKLNRYVEMGLSAARFQPDSVFRFAEEINEIEELEESDKVPFQQLLLAHAWRNFNRDSSLYYGEEALDKLKEAEAHKEYLVTQNLLGLGYERNSNFVKAEAAYLDGISYSETVDSTDFPIHFIYGNLGSLYSRVHAFDLAIEMFEKFLEHEDNPNDRCNIKSKLAVNLIELEQPENAVQMLEPCLDYEELVPPIKAIVRRNLSEMLQEMGDHSRSLQLMEKASVISSQYRIPNLQIAHLIRLGNQYLDHGLIQKADSVRSLIETVPVGEANHKSGIDKYGFFANLALANDNYDLALMFADSAIDRANEANVQQFLLSIYETKAEIYEQTGKPDLALENYRYQHELQNSENSRKRQKDMAMMKVRFQLQNSENRLAMITSQLSLLNTRYVLLAGLAFTLTLMAGFIYFRYRSSRKSAETAVTELRNREVTIRMLKETLQEQNRKLKERNIPEWIELNAQVRLSLDEIRYIRSDGNYVKIYLADASRPPIMERMTLKECKENLPEEIFIRIHRSFLVNLRHVSHVNNEILYLKDNTELKISRRYRKEVLGFLN